MSNLFQFYGRKISPVFLVIGFILMGGLLSGCGVKEPEQEKALIIIHVAEPDFEQLAQDSIKNDSAFEETENGGFGWRFEYKSLISNQIFARYGYWSNHPKWLVFLGNILGEVFGINPWPENAGVYFGLTIDLEEETVRFMNEWEKFNYED